MAVVLTSGIMLWVIWRCAFLSEVVGTPLLIYLCRNNWRKLSDEALMRIAVSDANAHLSNIEDPHAV